MLEWQELRRRRGIAAFTTILAVVALVAPLRPAASPETSIGLLLGLAAVLEWLHGQRRPTLRERMAAWREGTVSLVMAALLISAPLLSAGALVVFLAAQFIWRASAGCGTGSGAGNRRNGGAASSSGRSTWRRGSACCCSCGRMRRWSGPWPLPPRSACSRSRAG